MDFVFMFVLQKGEYVYLADLVEDLKLMFNNAMQYNQESSLIYNVS